MKKISLKDIKDSLKRDEMRMIYGGSGGSGGTSGGCGNGYWISGGCVSTCNNDNDCNCIPCNRPGVMMYCSNKPCAISSTSNVGIKICSC